VGGSARIINQHANFDRMEFSASDKFMELPGAKPCPEWTECVMYRKDRSHPIAIREYLDEVYREPFTGNKDGRNYTVNGPWQTHTKRFLRHKTMIQASRLVFGFVGITDQDEAERILEGQARSGRPRLHRSTAGRNARSPHRSGPGPRAFPPQETPGRSPCALK
jgi:hypothetical protein